MALLGGVCAMSLPIRTVVRSRASFAVDEHNEKVVQILSFNRKTKVVKAKAKVWVKPWLNFKEFKPASAINCSDLGCKKDEHGSGSGSGWREVPGDDPEVQEVAEFAVMIINQRCNCSIPYELEEVVHANAEVTGEAVKFNMLLKLKILKLKMEHKFKVEVHKNHEGVLHLNHFELHRD